MNLLKKTLEDFQNRVPVDRDTAGRMLDALISESDERLIADVLTAWNDKGIEDEEIFSIAQIMRERCLSVYSSHRNLIDLVGTGGSRAKTFNVSTAAAFVVAGAGFPVAKHGNKAATSSTGSADVLEKLGLSTSGELTPERSLKEFGICFMFAPNHHRLSPVLGKVRRGLGFPTIFNCVGPLSNPAAAQNQLIGVWAKHMVPKMAGALAQLGTAKSWIVHGGDGLDEITLSGLTHVAEVEGSTIREFEIRPEDFGFPAENVDRLRADSPAASAKFIENVLCRESRDTIARRIVTMNAAAAICLVDESLTLKGGVKIAAESIESGSAFEKLSQLRDASRI